MASFKNIRAIAALLVCAFVLVSGQVAGAAPVLTTCGSNIDYPPYLYGANDAPRGVVIDILKHAWPSSPFSVRKLPWRRCLKLAELGQIDLVLNVPTAQIDPAPFYITETYAQLHSVYFVASSRWPRGIAIRNVQDLRSYRVCGLMGNRYDSYGLPAKAVDIGANSYRALIGKLEAGFCDMFIEKREVIDGLLKFDKPLANMFADAKLVVTALPEDSPIGLHFAVSRASPRATKLLGQLNGEIASLTRMRVIARWEREHMDRSLP